MGRGYLNKNPVGQFHGDGYAHRRQTEPLGEEAEGGGQDGFAARASTQVNSADNDEHLDVSEQ
jgi:hypothetical protein